MAETTKEQITHPIEEANWLSRLSLYWMDKTLKTGSKRKLTEDDLLPTLEKNRMENLTSEVERHWEKELVASELRNRKPRLWRALARCFSWKEYLVMIGLRVLRFLCTIGIPVLMWLFLKDLSSGSVSIHTSTYFYVPGISLLILVKGVSFQNNALMSEIWSIRLKVCCIGLIYKKILFAFNRRDLQNILTGKAINLVSNDAQILEKVVLSLMLLSSAPLEILASGFLLWYLIGWQALTGAVFFVIVAVYICPMSHYCGTLRDKSAAVTDRRLEVMSEIVSGIRAVKIHAWEGNFTDAMKKVRKEEVSPIRKRGLIISSFSAFNFTAVPIAGFVSTAALIYTGQHATAFQIFTVFSCFGIFNYAINLVMGSFLHFLKEANVAIKRIERFIGNGYAFPVCRSKKANTSRKYTLEHRRVPGFPPKGNTFSNIAFTSSIENITGISYVKKNEGINVRQSEDVSLLLRNICCSWSNEERETLTNISLAVREGQMVAVTGPVGSGKSSLLKVILGELPVSNGSMSCKGNIAYVPQIPWVFSGTLRENILFGKDFDPRKFQKVIEACSLQKDLDGFAKGDLTQIGQRGVRLSGGQRQRVSMARALYSDAAIYLLDDPLSAVDAKVGQNLFDSCICEFLSERTRVLVTHQLHFLTNMEHMIVLNKGRVTFEGSYHQLREMDESWKAVLSDGLCNNELLKKQKMENANYPLTAAAKPDQLDLETLKDLEEEVEETSVGSVTWRTYWKFFKVALPPSLIYLLAVFIVGIKGNRHMMRLRQAVNRVC